MALDILGKLDELGIPYEEAEVEVIGGVEYRGYNIATNLTNDQIREFYDYIGSDPDRVREYNEWVTAHPLKAARDLQVEWTKEEIEEARISQQEKQRMQINVTVKGEEDGSA